MRASPSSSTPPAARASACGPDRRRGPRSLAIAILPIILLPALLGASTPGASGFPGPRAANSDDEGPRGGPSALERIERRFVAATAGNAEGAAGSDAGASHTGTAETGTRGGTAPRARAEVRRREAALRALVLHGLLGGPDDRRDALVLLAAAVSPVRPVRALRILAGEGSRPDLVRSDPEVRRGAFRAMAQASPEGVRALVRLAVEEDEPVRLDAAQALPEALPPEALALLADELASGRELFVNRAAMIAGAHGAATLIPNLIAAQYEPPRERRGDEAWIAIGKSISYIAGAVPIVGDASGAFQPVPGTIFEGSVLRIMESVVEVYRTEVHVALASTVEAATGLPAPPFGYDRDRWLAWYRDEFPALARAHAERESLRETEVGVRSERATGEG